MAEDRTSRKNTDFLENGRDISLVEMGRDDVTVSCTYGKIIMWFGRQASETTIWKVIFGISKIDSSVNHEQELICDFDTISEYENMGYILTSYAKTRGGYRVIFNVPFSKKFALAEFVESITDELKEKDVRKTLHWNGSPDRIVMIYNELKKLERWKIKHLVYKSEEEKVFR